MCHDFPVKTIILSEWVDKKLESLFNHKWCTGWWENVRMCYNNWMPQQTWRWSQQTPGASVSRSTNYWYQETPRQTRGGNTAKQIRNNLKIPRIRRQAQGLVWGCVPDTGRYFRHGYIHMSGRQLIMWRRRGCTVTMLFRL